MTGPDNTPATRPISVAELLAKNGTIGSPPVGGGRRRRRRGNNDAVTVAELTGEIPLVRIDDSGELPVVEFVEQSDESESDDGAVAYDSAYDAVTESGSNGNGSSAVIYDTESAVESSRPVNRLERAPEPLPRRGRGAPPERREYPRPRRHDDVRPQRESAVRPATGAESMSPDPIDDAMVIIYQSADTDLAHTEVAVPDELGIGDATHVRDDDVSPGLLFSGDSMADEMARAGSRSADDDLAPIAGDLSDDLLGDHADSAEDLDDVDLSEAFDDEDDYDLDAYDDEPSRGRLVLHGLVIALQSILAVAFGAGLFLAFDQLWQWNSLVAMVLAILATLGLVAGVWVVRKTEDIASTLIAVGVGLLVTFGPLALMHAS